MPHRIKQAPARYEGLRPGSREERRSLVKIAGFVVAVLVGLVGFWLVQRHWQEVRELTWSRATGTIEDVRPVLAGKFDGKYEGAMLYEVQVLAKFTADGASREEWITVRQRPERLEDVRFQAFRWKGSKCVVRWNPSNVGQVVVDVRQGGRRAGDMVEKVGWLGWGELVRGPSTSLRTMGLCCTSLRMTGCRG